MKKVILTTILAMYAFMLQASAEAVETDYFYVVAHATKTKDYWAITQDGKRGLWLKENDIKGEHLKINENFMATFDHDKKLLTAQKYILGKF